MITTTSRENVIVLRVGYDAYASLIRELGDRARPRAAYDGEALGLMSPSEDHERYNRLLEGLLMLAGDEWNLRIATTGSVTLQAEPHGAEPDSSFYVDNVAFRLDANEIDLAVDPPPDIVVEIDISRARIDKRPIYAGLCVRELWRFDGDLLRGYAFRDGTYEQSAVSTVIADLPLATLGEFLELRRTSTDFDIRRAWQVWLRTHRPDGSNES